MEYRLLIQSGMGRKKVPYTGIPESWLERNKQNILNFMDDFFFKNVIAIHII